MSIDLGNGGLSVDDDSSGGGGFVNPYAVFSGLNSYWAPDAPQLVQDVTLGPSVCAVQTQSAIEDVPLLMRSDPTSAPTLSTFSSPTKKGFTFDGTSTQFLVSWEPGDDIANDAGFTLFASIKTTDAISVLGCIYGKGYAVGRWRISTTTGFAKFDIYDSAATQFTILSDVPVSDGAVHTLICIYDPANAPGPTITMYVDGVLQAAVATDNGLPLGFTPEPVSLGSCVAINYTGSFGYTGEMRDVGSINVPLHGADIAALNAIMNARNA